MLSIQSCHTVLYTIKLGKQHEHFVAKDENSGRSMRIDGIEVKRLRHAVFCITCCFDNTPTNHPQYHSCS